MLEETPRSAVPAGAGIGPFVQPLKSNLTGKKIDNLQTQKSKLSEQIKSISDALGKHPASSTQPVSNCSCCLWSRGKSSKNV